MAFTLVELLVVVSIIAVLLALLLPAISKAKELGRRCACASNQRQMGLAFLSYAQDWEGFFPGWGWSTPSGSGYYWHQTIAPYLGYGNIVQYATSPAGKSLAAMECPTAKTKYPSKPEYWLYTLNSRQINPNVYRLSKVTSPSKKPYSADHTYTAWYAYPDGDISVQLNIYQMPVPYHGGNANFLFFDGHVAALASNSLWNAIYAPYATYYYSEFPTAGAIYPY